MQQPCDGKMPSNLSEPTLK